MTQFRKFSGAACIAAALSMTTAPAYAAELPVSTAPETSLPGVTVFDADALNAERYRRYRHRNRVDLGDVLTGVLIIGGVAAIANSVSKPRRDRRRAPEPRYRERSSERSSQGGRGIDRAVNMCLAEIERDVRVQNVDSVDRTGEGWNVTGTIYNGDGFSCQIGNDGRVSNVNYAGRVAQSQAQDRQWDDARYREARLRSDTQGPVQAEPTYDTPSGAQPSYPGGPVNGQPVYDGDLGG